MSQARSGDRRHLIVVSNRPPVSYRLADSGERIASRGGGGLVTALAPLVSQHDVTWIASALTEEDRAVATEAGGAAFSETGRDDSLYRLRLVVHEPTVFDRFYNRFANPALWFLQHYLWDLVQGPSVDEDLHDAWAGGYVPVNEAFAAAVLETLEEEPAAAVLFHDYHLYLAPRFVREARPDAVLSHFVHVPWPQPDYWSVLPRCMRHAIHDGLLANDVVGFHTARWRDNFLSSAAAHADAVVDAEAGAVTHGGRCVQVAAHPIAVDTREFEELAASSAVRAAESSLAEIRPERLILRVDRTDPSKNVVRGFLAFELFLERHPEARGRVGMLALLDPSRQAIPQYTAYLEEITAAVDRVNTRFGDDAWQPVRLEVEDDFPRAVAAYKQYDVLLVNAVFDGMNLIAKEAPLVNERDGVLILSENVGAHEELSAWTVTVSPLDLVDQAEAIQSALSMPEDERRARAEAIRAHVREHDLTRWLESQLSELDRVFEAARR